MIEVRTADGFGRREGGTAVSSIQDVLRLRCRQAWLRQAPIAGDGEGTTLLARARPESVLVEEKYRVRQEVSRNPDVRLEPGAVGMIEVRVPYDGYEHFTRSALEDFRQWVMRHPDQFGSTGAGWDEVTVTEAQIGHLVVTDHQDTDLDEVLGQSNRTMAVPLRIPVRSADLRNDDALVADRYTFRRKIQYHPASGRPALVPVQLHVEVTDPGSVSVPQIDPRHQIDVGEAVVLSQEYMTFRSYLELNIQVQVDLPGRKGWNPPAPVVRWIRLSLPSGLTLALTSVELAMIDGGSDPDGKPPIVQHNPNEAGIEWFDIPLELVKKADGPTTFMSPRMRVRIHQPGELFSESEVLVRAHIETNDVLLSGTQVRLFDARGRRVGGRRNPLTVRSSVTAEATVVLDDAFAKRKFTPQQSFHFDEVIPGPARVQDILSALADLRFEVETSDIPADTTMSKSQTLIARVAATRGDDEDAIRLYLFVLGRQQRTRRQSQHPGGRRYTSKLDTGDLTLVVFGEAPRDSSRLIHEVNALQLGLRDRFRRMKAQR